MKPAFQNQYAGFSIYFLFDSFESGEFLFCFTLALNKI